MIELYTWPTPNGHKVHILLEECGLDYNVHPIDFGKGDQFGDAFLKISPNNKIPAIIDTDGPDGDPFALFESGAILIYLADKEGQFIPPAENAAARYRVLEWLMFQMGGIGPMFGQNHHFVHYAAEQIPYAIERYVNETGRLYGVAEKRLADVPYLAGDDYSIADMAAFPWMRNIELRSQKVEDFPNVKRWIDAIAARPAVQRGLKVLEGVRRQGPLTDEQREIMFGETQYKSR